MELSNTPVLIVAPVKNNVINFNKNVSLKLLQHNKNSLQHRKIIL